jgi:hypothetical protein
VEEEAVARSFARFTSRSFSSFVERRGYRAAVGRPLGRRVWG